MIFQFEHLGLWDNVASRLDIKAYKHVLNRWQKQLENIGWNALFIENHDQPRRVSTWEMTNNIGILPRPVMRSSTFTTKARRFIYQGQEIGMTNYPFTDIEQFDDVSVKMNIVLCKKRVAMLIHYLRN